MLSAALAVLVLAGCDASKKATTTPAPSGSQASAGHPSSKTLSSKTLVGVVCHETKTGSRFMIGEPGKHAPSGEQDEETAIDLPFAVEVGSAVPFAGGFAVAALKGNDAVLVAVADSAARGAEVPVGKVHGDVEPPKLASRDDRVVGALVGNDAGGATLTLFGVEHTGETPHITRGPEVSRERDGSTAFDLALGNERGLLVWDHWDKRSARGTIEALAFNPNSLEASGPPTLLSTPAEDAEMPRVVASPGGFWLGWVSHTVVEAPARARAAGVASAPKAALQSVMDTAPRRIKLVPLDHRGVPTAEPRLVTDVAAHVVAYDMVPLGAGVLLAWRDDPSTPGTEAPKVSLAKVGADGSVTTAIIDDEQLAAGTPRLFSDEAAKGAPRVWLSLMGKAGLNRVGFFDDQGALSAPLVDVPGLGRSEPLALSGGRFLTATPNGRALDLAVTRCKPESKKADVEPGGKP